MNHSSNGGKDILRQCIKVLFIGTLKVLSAFVAIILTIIGKVCIGIAEGLNKIAH